MLADRAPGSDGFTGAFYKTSWLIIKHDVLAAINCFASAETGTTSILSIMP
jgi:hypothetical protein